MARKQKDPVVADQGGKAMPVDPGVSIPSTIEDRIRERAYQLYQQRGGNDGSSEQDWLLAEAEVENRNPKEGPTVMTEEKQVREKTLDKTLADSFPTSDPPSSIPDPSTSDSEDDSEAA
ncbi:MAG: DUF2934 domain-containing protein [Candidatus Korobacteraceae bacterium]